MSYRIQFFTAMMVVDQSVRPNGVDVIEVGSANQVRQDLD